MTQKNPLVVLSLVFSGVFPAIAQADVVCVENGSEQGYFFVVEGRGGTEERVAQSLAPTETLCVPGAAGGVVSVFVNENAMEGCSRLVGPGETETLLDYSEFDRCRWSSNDG